MTNIIIIGGMKCGTTSLYEYLLDCPDIVGPVTKEPEYFSRHFGAKKWKKGSYEDLFIISEEKRYLATLEASTGYTKFPNESGVAQRMAEYGLRPKLVYIVRDPLERIESHYNFMLRDTTKNSEINSDYIITLSDYNFQIAQYEAVFPAHDICVVNFSEFRKNPEQVCNKVLSFAGLLKHDFNKDAFVVKNKTAATTHNREVIKAMVRPLTNLLPQSMRNGLAQLVGTVAPVRKVKLTEEQANQIRQRLDESTRSFCRKYKIDIKEWSYFLGA